MEVLLFWIGMTMNAIGLMVIFLLIDIRTELRKRK